MDAKTTEQLARDWKRAEMILADRRRQLEDALAEFTRSSEELAARIAPRDIQAGEKIALWVRFDRHEEALLVVEKLDLGYAVTRRANRKPEEAP
jgi:hypothetical protein